MAKAPLPSGGYTTAPSVLASGAPGNQTTGFLNPVTSIRDMKCITVSMSELHNLSIWSGITSLFFGLATTCWGISIGIYTSLVNSDPKTMTGASQVLQNTDEPILFGAGFVFLAASVASFFFSGSTIRLIKKEMRK